MAEQGLRAFLERIEAAGELCRIPAEVDPVLEIAAITARVGKTGGRALWFERVRGHDFPVLTNLFGSRLRISLALGFDRLEDMTSRLEEDLADFQGTGEECLRRLVADYPPRGGKHAPCREVTAPADLSQLPALKSWPGDGGRFLTLPLVFTRDPETGESNCGIYRMQIFDSRRAAMHWRPGSDGARHYAAWGRRGERMPVAVALGGDPQLIQAAAAPLPAGVDELAFAGYLRRRALATISCRTGHLQLPASAEFILEGYVEVGETRPEGPFGNHTGTYAPAALCPVFHLTSLTRRGDALFPATVVGPPPMENAWLAKATERLFLPLLRRDVPEIAEIEMPLMTIFHGCALVKIRKPSPRSAPETIRRLWRTGLFRSARLLVLLDEAADLQNYADCYWRIVNRTDPARDLIVDGARVGIDATGIPGPPVASDPATRRLVERRWEEYGID